MPYITIAKIGRWYFHDRNRWSRWFCCITHHRFNLHTSSYGPGVKISLCKTGRRDDCCVTMQKKHTNMVVKRIRDDTPPSTHPQIGSLRWCHGAIMDEQCEWLSAIWKRRFLWRWQQEHSHRIQICGINALTQQKNSLSPGYTSAYVGHRKYYTGVFIIYAPPCVSMFRGLLQNIHFVY